MLKSLIKKLIPLSVWESYRKMMVSKYKDRSPKEVFTDIYKTNRWKSSESVSGKGSELSQVETLIGHLNTIIRERNISSMLDIPCGDFNWMRRVNLDGVNYIGADIVEPLIEKNREANSGLENISFRVLDLTTDDLPQCDLIFVRDCLVHLSYDDIFKALRNIKKSGCKYFFTTTYPNDINYDIITGDWRKLNLMAKPFNFPDPVLIVNENCTEGNGEFVDKSMVLWDLRKIDEMG